MLSDVRARVATRAAYASILLTIAGTAFSWYGSRVYGGIESEGLATVLSMAFLVSVIVFVVATKPVVRGLAGGLFLGVWVGLIDPDRVAWATSGLALLALALWLAMPTEPLE